LYELVVLARALFNVERPSFGHNAQHNTKKWRRKGRQWITFPNVKFEGGPSSNHWAVSLLGCLCPDLEGAPEDLLLGNCLSTITAKSYLKDQRTKTKGTNVAPRGRDFRLFVCACKNDYECCSQKGEHVVFRITVPSSCSCDLEREAWWVHHAWPAFQ